LGLTVARQLTTEAGGVLGKLKYTKKDSDSGQAAITLRWPVNIIS
jgi:hypothetical protein